MMGNYEWKKMLTNRCDLCVCVCFLLYRYTPNPKNADYLMAIIPREECLYGPDDSSCVKDLFVSFDFGESWGNVTQNSQKRIAGFWEANWACGLDASDQHGSKTIENDYTDKTILASVYEDLDHVHGLDKWSWNYDSNIHFVRSDDWFGSKHEKIFSCGNIMKKIGNLVYLVAPASCSLKNNRGKTQEGNKRSHELATDDDHAHLYVSEDLGKTFKEVCLPVALQVWPHFAFLFHPSLPHSLTHSPIHLFGERRYFTGIDA